MPDMHGVLVCNSHFSSKGIEALVLMITSYDFLVFSPDVEKISQHQRVKTQAGWYSGRSVDP